MLRPELADQMGANTIPWKRIQAARPRGQPCEGSEVKCRPVMRSPLTARQRGPFGAGD